MKKGFVFYGLLDFYKNKEVVVEIYNKMNIDEKEIYKMYVYSLPFMEDDIKDLIWDYINGFEESQFDLALKHKKAKEKYEKRKRESVFEVEENRID